jgi:hypothetical protein
MKAEPLAFLEIQNSKLKAQNKFKIQNNKTKKQDSYLLVQMNTTCMVLLIRRFFYEQSETGS